MFLVQGWRRIPSDVREFINLAASAIALFSWGSALIVASLVGVLGEAVKLRRYIPNPYYEVLLVGVALVVAGLVRQLLTYLRPGATGVPPPPLGAAAVVDAAPPSPPPISYTDASVETLMELAATPNLTDAQRSLVLAPYVGHWLPGVEGIVDHVSDETYAAVRRRIVQVVLKDNPSGRRIVSAFLADAFQDRAAALSLGARVRLTGRFRSVTLGVVQMDECELLK